MKTKLLLLLGLAVSLGFPGVALAEEKPAKQGTPVVAPVGPARPKPNLLRYEENWQGLKTLPQTDLLDPLKFIFLNSDGQVYLSFGGQLRLRGEGFSNFGFANKADPDKSRYGLGRLHLHADLHVYDYVRLFVEGRTAWATDRLMPGGQRAIDVDALDLQNGFLDLKLPFGQQGGLTLRTGRQELSFGKQRLISPLPWANAQRSFDGVRGIFQWDAWRVDGWWSMLAENKKFEFNAPNPGISMFGVYATGAIPQTPLKADLYWLGLNREKSTFAGVAGAESRQTVGGHVFGSPFIPGVDVDVEGGYQFGSQADQSIGAYFVASQAGYTFKDVPTSPRIYLGFDMASGDSDPTDQTLGTFNQLFPLGHAYYGFIDVLGRQNAMDISAGIQLKPLEQWQISLDAHMFQRANTADGIYDVTGALFRAGKAGSSAAIGTELDLVNRFQVDNHLGFEVGLCYFIPGAFIVESGTSQNITFGYVQSTYQF